MGVYVSVSIFGTENILVSRLAKRIRNGNSDFHISLHPVTHHRIIRGNRRQRWSGKSKRCSSRNVNKERRGPWEYPIKMTMSIAAQRSSLGSSYTYKNIHNTLFLCTFHSPQGQLSRESHKLRTTLMHHHTTSTRKSMRHLLTCMSLDLCILGVNWYPHTMFASFVHEFLSSVCDYHSCRIAFFFPLLPCLTPYKLTTQITLFKSTIHTYLSLSSIILLVLLLLLLFLLFLFILITIHIHAHFFLVLSLFISFHMCILT